MAERESGALYRSDARLAYLSLLPSAIILVALSLIPAIMVFNISLRAVETGEDSGPFVGLENFWWALSEPAFFNALVNSLIWTFGSVFLELIIGVGLALLLDQSFRLRGLARAAILAPYLVPTVVAVLTWRFMFHDLVGVFNYILLSIGLVNEPVLWLNEPVAAMAAVILVGVWKFFPFVVIAILGILQAIPREQFEAARIDGASAWRRFRVITLPQIMPVLLLSAVLRMIWTFHKFDIIYLLTGGGPLDATTTLPVMVYLQGFHDMDLGRAAAVAVITMLILSSFLVVYLFLQRRAERAQ